MVKAIRAAFRRRARTVPVIYAQGGPEGERVEPLVVSMWIEAPVRVEVQVEVQ